jgi:dTDP-4-dehydrorhamnose reductase
MKQIYLNTEWIIMPKHILVTGANGQVGKEFQSLVSNNAYDGMVFHFTDRDLLDITDKQALEDFIRTYRIDTIVNCAAYTAVDKAEEEEALAYQVNYEAVKYLAELSKAYGIRLIHISTDYVFDGKSHTPFKEDDITNPQGVYARSKYAGEKAIIEIAPKGTIIIRTSWVYSSTGHNFVNTMLRLGGEKDMLNVVCDQIGTPTYARDLARTILMILTEQKEIEGGVEIYHYSNEGNCSWYDFAQAIFEMAEIDCRLSPVTTEAYPTPAKRPAYSVLNKEKIKAAYDLEIPYWRDSLRSCLSLMDVKDIRRYKIGIIGSGFIANGLAKLLLQHPDYTLQAVLTRTNLNRRTDFIKPEVLTNELEDLIETCDLIVECSGDAIYATETIDRILKEDIPVVTMNSEFHVTTGSYFVDKGLVTEAEGDQPGVEAILHEEALAMGFKPVAYVNIKGFLNENPTKEDMEYWGAKSNLSLEMVTSFTDGTKVQIEQVLVANGLGACLAREGLMKIEDDDMLHGGTILAEEAKKIGCPVSDYVLSPKLPAGVFLVVEHDAEQIDSLRYYKLGEGPYYVLERTYHLCHLEIIKTIKRVLSGGGVLLNNSATPRYSVAAIAKHDIRSGEKLKKAIGSFDVRGEAVEISNHPNHVPIGLLADATFIREVKKGEIVTFDDVKLPETLALRIWKEII